jgi:hypothetical protein
MVVWGIAAGSAAGQAPPAQTATPAPDDTPSIRIGATLFADYTFTNSPEAADSDGNIVHPSAFNVGRSYINITGNISHLVAFRLTPDIARDTTTGSSLNGSLTFRVKYAFAQVNLDEWITPGSWTRFGIQQTPWVDFEEGIYRYRFQGTVYSEREGYLSSSDGGASFRYNAPKNYGEVHVGVYNGENYNRAEVNNQKALQVRGSVRPFAQSAATLWHGLRAHLFYDADHYVRDGERRRFIASTTFEHKYVNAGFEYLSATDQASARLAGIDSHGYSLWATPRSPSGWELLLRHDRHVPNADHDDQTRSRNIFGVAYWFPHQGNVSSALLLDYDGQTFHNIPLPKQQRVAVHALVNF